MSKEEIIEKYSLNIKKDLEIVDNVDFITCRICGHQGSRLYGKHFNFAHNGINSKEYGIIFPGALTKTKKDTKSTTINGGKHMKTEKYKQMFSEMFSGEKNPMHKSKTTEEFRKANSPFSIDFYNKHYPDITQDERQAMLHVFAKDSVKNRVGNTTIEYFLNQGMSQEEAKKALHERQAVGRLDKFIERHGKEEGEKKWKERQTKWKTSLVEGGNMTCGYSDVSQKLFNSIEERILINNFYYATKNSEYYINLGKGEFYQYDFCDRDNKKIIEFNGDIYHANPSIYKETDRPNPFRQNLTSKMMWDKDIIKKQVAEEKGFKVLIIWENDYKNDPDKVIEDCIRFLRD